MDFSMPWGALVEVDGRSVDLDLSIHVRVTDVIGDDAPEIEFLGVMARRSKTGKPFDLPSDAEASILDNPKLDTAILVWARDLRQYERDEAADNKREMMREAANG